MPGWLCILLLVIGVAVVAGSSINAIKMNKIIDHKISKIDEEKKQLR